MKHKSYGLDLISAVLGQIPSDWFRRARGRWVFRGHSDKNYSLIPSVGRVPYPANHRIKYERSLFNMFRREAREHVESLPSEWEWLALARHHGLPTRLLDWSNNPLIALYFAVEHHNSRDGELLALYAPRKASEKMIANASPFSIRDLCRPREFIGRMFVITWMEIEESYSSSDYERGDKILTFSTRISSIISLSWT